MRGWLWGLAVGTALMISIGALERAADVPRTPSWLKMLYCLSGIITVATIRRADAK